jgi:hypothetical protein
MLHFRTARNEPARYFKTEARDSKSLDVGRRLRFSEVAMVVGSKSSELSRSIFQHTQKWTRPVSCLTPYATSESRSLPRRAEECTTHQNNSAGFYLRIVVF